MRQARAAQASVHVPDNMASKRQLTTLGCYGNSPPPQYTVAQAPIEVIKTTSHDEETGGEIAPVLRSY